MTIALTSGEPSGIGPDIAIIYAQKERSENLRIYADPDALIERAKLLNLPLILKESSTNKAGELSIFPIKSKEKPCLDSLTQITLSMFYLSLNRPLMTA